MKIYTSDSIATLVSLVLSFHQWAMVSSRTVGEEFITDRFDLHYTLVDVERSSKDGLDLTLRLLDMQYTGVWFETLFIIFINVFKIDIIYIIFNFWDIIHYFCKTKTLFKWIWHYLTKLIWIYAESASFSPEIPLFIVDSFWTQPGPQSAAFSYLNGSNSLFCL